MQAALCPSSRHVGPSPRAAAQQPRRAAANVRASPRALSSNDIKNGMSIMVDGNPCQVVEFLHVKPGKGSAFVRTKIKNYVTGNTKDHTFRAGEPLQAADVERSDQQYSYPEGDTYVFMNMETFEETRLETKALGAGADYLVEGMDVRVLEWDGKVIGVDLPNTVRLAIAETEPGVKGNSATGAEKNATLVTGKEIRVPLFLNEGDIVEVDTRDGKYIRRITE